MVKKTLGSVELVWTCPNCNSLNPGSARFCMSCGAPMPADVKFSLPKQQTLLTDEEKLKHAAIGADIHCPFCNTRNPGNAKFCQSCGGDLSGGLKRETGEVLGAFSETPAKPVICPKCGTENPPTNLRCTNCGASLAPEPVPQPVTAPTESVASPRAINPLVIAVIALGVIALCVVVGWIISRAGRTEAVIGTVQDARWVYSLPIEALVPAQYQNWDDQIPADARVDSCQEQVRGQSDSPVPNSVEVCGTPYTVDTGGGFGEVVQDCYYEVYDNYCSYTVDEWRIIDTVTSSGSGFNPAWPQVSLSSGQQLGRGTETYSVIFSTVDGTLSYTPSSLQEYQSFTPGSTWTLEINGFGNLVGVQP